MRDSLKIQWVCFIALFDCYTKRNRNSGQIFFFFTEEALENVCVCVCVVVVVVSAVDHASKMLVFATLSHLLSLLTLFFTLEYCLV